MSVWNRSALLGIYTLTPTHCGTGQTTGAVDLPIARDAATGFPILPATGVKGVARDVLEQDRTLQSGQIDELFGPSLDGAERPDAIRAGLLAFTEARLLAYPVRSLSRPFLHVTCPLILEHFARDLRTLGLPPLLGIDWSVPRAADDRTTVLVSDAALGRTTLVLEDLIYPADEVGHLESVKTLAGHLATLLPAEEKDSRSRLESGLVIIPDPDFACLLETAIPVQARIKLTGGKTTDAWENPETDETETGSLWYEEQLPSDCLFVALIGERRQRTAATGAAAGGAGSAGLDDLLAQAQVLGAVQIGGNETVGQGLCLWTLVSK